MNMPATRLCLALLIALCTTVLVGCGSSSDDNDDDIDVLPVLPGLRILSVTSIGQGDEIVVQVELAAPTSGFAPSSVFLGMSATSPAAVGRIFRNDVVTSSTGAVSGNGILGIVPPSSGTLVITFRISSRTPDLLPVGDGATLIVNISDGIQLGEARATFDIDPQVSLINEPICSIGAPLGGLLSGVITIQVDVTDAQSDPIDATFVYSIDGGLTYLPCTIEPGSSPFLGAYTPTDPANTFAAPGNQVTNAAPPSISVRWLSASDLPAAFARQRVSVGVFVEDGTTMGAGPFSLCASRISVDNSPLPAAPAQPLTVVAPGLPALLDPTALLGGTALPLGTSAHLLISGAGVSASSAVVINPVPGVALAGYEFLGTMFGRADLRATPDGPSPLLDDAAQLAALSSRLVMVDSVFFGSIDVIAFTPLISLSSDSFTVAPGGIFNVGIQVSGAGPGGSLVTAYSAVVHYDDGALDLTDSSGGTNSDFSADPSTMQVASPTGFGIVTVFADPVMRMDLANPIMNVANLTFRVSPSAAPGTIFEIWLEEDDIDNLVLQASGGLLRVSGGLRILGTSVVVN